MFNSYVELPEGILPKPLMYILKPVACHNGHIPTTAVSNHPSWPSLGRIQTDDMGVKTSVDDVESGWVENIKKKQKNEWKRNDSQVREILIAPN